METEPSADAPPRRRLREHAWAALALLVAGFHFASFDVFTRPVVTDIRYFLYCAWRVAEGDAPHLDVFDPKTQLASLVGALYYLVGSWLEVEQLFAIRIGYLSIAAIGAWLAYFVHRILGGGSAVTGMLGVLAMCAFGFLGVLPATGNIPKLLMMVFASAGALCVYHRRWFWGGVAGSLAFLDWQIGALVWVGAFATAALFGRRRARACLHVILGGAVGLAPFVVWLWAKGALGAAVDQTIFAAFFRGSTRAGGLPLAQHVDLLFAQVQRRTPGHTWLFLASLVGIVLAVTWLVRRRRSGDMRLLLPLCIHHFGILGFSLIDFQAKGDVFALLHTMSFFLALVGIQLYVWAVALATRWAPRSARSLPVLFIALALVAARPGRFRPKADVAAFTLADQQQVARKVMDLTKDGTLAVVENSEVLFLARRVNPLPFIYWNEAAWSSYRRSSSERPPESLRRLLDSVAPDALIVWPNMGNPTRFELYGLKDPGTGWKERRIRSDSGKYWVRLHLR